VTPPPTLRERSPLPKGVAGTTHQAWFQKHPPHLSRNVGGSVTPTNLSRSVGGCVSHPAKGAPGSGVLTCSPRLV